MDFVGFTWLCNFGAPEMLFGLAAMSDTSLHPGANVTRVYYSLPLPLFAHRGELSPPGWPGCAATANALAQPSPLSEAVPEAALQASTPCLMAKARDREAELQIERFWLKPMYKRWGKLRSTSRVWMQRWPRGPRRSPCSSWLEDGPSQPLCQHAPCSNLLSGVLGKSVLMLWQKNEGWGVKVFFPWGGERIPPLSASGERLLLEPSLALPSLPTASAVQHPPPPCVAQPGLHLGTGIFGVTLRTRDKFSFIFTSPASLCALFQAAQS